MYIVEFEEIVRQSNVRMEYVNVENINYRYMPTTYFNYNSQNVKIWNKLIKILQKYGEDHMIDRTMSGGIKKNMKLLNVQPLFDLKRSNNGAEITYIGTKSFRLQIGSSPDNKSIFGKYISGRHAFNIFKNTLKMEKVMGKNTVNFENYKIENGEEVNSTIEKPYIKMGRSLELHQPYYGVNHIDIHSAYAGGLVKSYPEFEPVIKHFYTLRQKKSEDSILYKSIPNLAIGFMHSSYCQYQYSHISKAAIENTNRLLDKLTNLLLEAGRTPLLYNTDGIWYEGDIYHNKDAGEGKLYGMWENNHVNCKFKAKSVGCYQYEEDGVYHPVVRGQTLLDKKLPRSRWKWDDIYSLDASEIIEYYIDDDFLIEEIIGGK